jgi:hypothetical protein
MDVPIQAEGIQHISPLELISKGNNICAGWRQQRNQHYYNHANQTTGTAFTSYRNTLLNLSHRNIALLNEGTVEPNLSTIQTLRDMTSLRLYHSDEQMSILLQTPELSAVMLRLQREQLNLLRSTPSASFSMENENNQLLQQLLQSEQRAQTLRLMLNQIGIQNLSPTITANNQWDELLQQLLAVRNNELLRHL